MSERTARRAKVVRMKKKIENYLDTLNYIQPAPRSSSSKFLDNSYAKAACMQLLEELDRVQSCPFDLTVLEVLEGYSNRMDRYACEHKNKEKAYCFVVASNTAQYFIEEYWKDQRRRA